MLVSAIRTAVALAAVLTGYPAAALAAGCVVADPTGTPLNVRSAPQGPVLSTLRNGTAVVVVDERVLGGKRWAKVAADGEARGWVFASYLDCAMAGDKMKSAPMHPRSPPQ